MKKSLVLALALAGVLAVAERPVLAQSMAYSGIMLADHSMRSSKLIGSTVTDEHGKTLGTVVDVLVKDQASEPVVVLKVANGSKMVAAPISHFQVEGKKVTMAKMTMAMVMALPAYDFIGVGLNGGGG